MAGLNHQVCRELDRAGCWSISGAKMQHENDLPLARATTGVGCQRVFALKQSAVNKLSSR